MWQYTDGNNGPEPHSVNGVGACDRDKFNGDIDQLLRLWGIEHPSAL
jgi:lysozyme